MPRVLVVATEFPPFAGGIGRYSGELADAARYLGAHVRVVAPTHGAPAQRNDELRYATRHDFHARDIGRAILAVRRGLRGFQPTVVHATDYRALVIARIALPFTRPSRFMVTCHGTEVKGANSAKLLIQRLAFAGTRVVVNSEYTASLVRARHRRVVPVVTPLGVNPSHFTSVRNSAESRGQLGIPDDSFVVLCVARFEPRKAQDVLVDAILRLPEDVAQKTHVLLVGRGDGTYFQSVAANARRARARVVIAGEVDAEALAAAYGSADVFCLLGRRHPTRAEGFGLVYLEAASQGIPSIAARVDAIPEVVIDGDTGVLVDPDDPISTAEAIARMQRDASRRRSMGEAAREWAGRHTWISTAKLTYAPWLAEPSAG